MRAAVTTWIATHGWHCPGYGTPAHPSHDLTADHLIPRSQGGIGSARGVLCRQCNARKRDGRRLQ
jgi:5-methylcytosine-specific restriction endonuclease McrA